MPPESAPVILWFRRDLRLADNPALNEAAASGRPVIPIYIHQPEAAGEWAEGGASRWWLHHSLESLGRSLAALGTPLRLLRGPADRVLPQLAQETGATSVLWNRRTEPWANQQDTIIAAELKALGITPRSFNAALLFQSGAIVSQSGRPFKVFTPFWKACLAAPPPAPPLPAPTTLRPWGGALAVEDLDQWGLLPTKPDWACGLRQSWQPGEAAAQSRLAEFLSEGVTQYAGNRDVPAQPGTSRLSPHLHFGEISPRQIFHAIRRTAEPGQGSERFLAELGWREFSAHLLHDCPDLPERPLRPEFERLAWRHDTDGLRAWQQGRTGYPLVDAGMRQLWATGWMHNRVRMVTASFLVKDLLVRWQEGEAWFWDTLVDADLASNAASWQWVAGCGADAAPFFRVFNPVLQGEKFDPKGRYVRQWCPELANLPDKWLHQPWRAPAQVLRQAGVVLGETYPVPLVDHDQARKRALAAFAELKA
ncbi:MAG: deoxyribodipyrimidine photo-lyase [Rhodospirillaceae bacterium]|nr:deoxyribodipyrimidine photo-lyase [Rhodospirillales bacterium]